MSGSTLRLLFQPTNKSDENETPLFYRCLADLYYNNFRNIEHTYDKILFIAVIQRINFFLFVTVLFSLTAFIGVLL